MNQDEKEQRLSAGAADGPSSARSDAELADACAAWQGGRDIGSSLLRTGARAVAGVPHYFHADFIADHDRRARAHPKALGQASILLAAVNASVARTADDWCAAVDLPATGFAGRGVSPKPAADEQILRTLTQTHRITMPLWGVSLDPGVAKSFGGTHPRWIFEIVGEFRGIPAWLRSGIKDGERELICGGEYLVQELVDAGSTTRVRLRYLDRVDANLGPHPATTVNLPS